MRTQHEMKTVHKKCRICGSNLAPFWGKHAIKRFCPDCKKQMVSIVLFAGGFILVNFFTALAVLSEQYLLLLGALLGSGMMVIAYPEFW